MITLDSVTKKFGARALFEDVTMTFNEGCRYGLTGPNGAGKSTLLKIVMGMEEPTSGAVSLPEKVGYLRQDIEYFKDFTLLETVIMGNKRLADALAERDGLYEGEMTDEVGIRLGEIEEVIADEDGYSADANAEMLLIGMGIEADLHEIKMSQVQVDRQFRALLCQALFGKPQALILDEPTNHLDMESIGWLEGFLRQYQGTLVVVSHDRHFLNTITTDTADIDYENVIVYPGNYDQMIVAKTSVRQRAESENKAKEKKISQLKDFVAKFGAGTRASQVQSRVREIDRLQPQELKKSNIDRPYIRFIPSEKLPGQVIFKVDGIQKTYDHPVIHNFSFEVLRGDKIAIIGNNGLGKTTILKMLAGHLTPDEGKISVGHQVQLGYFPQNHPDVIDKSQDINSFDWLKDKTGVQYDQEIRSALGKMLFGGDDAFKPLKALSGGETARVLFARLMLENPSVLIFDEPNNHLDLESVSALAWGLDEFKGTIIMASHDRDLINAFATKLLVFEENQITLFDGKLDEYLGMKVAKS